jgi:hypothetical protein
MENKRKHEIWRFLQYGENKLVFNSGQQDHEPGALRVIAVKNRVISTSFCMISQVIFLQVCFIIAIIGRN